MKTIEYRAIYNDVLDVGTWSISNSEEIIRVQARDINSGFAKALVEARKPLGNGRKREIVSVQFWQVV